MEVEQPDKIGFLFIPPQLFLRKSWAKRFCALYNSSSQGIQRLEVFDSDAAFLKQSKSPSKIIPLTDCVKVAPAPQKQQANVFEVRTKACCCQFSADSFQEMTEWLGALQAVAFGPARPSSGVFVTHSCVPDVKQEENLLYSSMDEPEVYSVKSLNTEAMLRNNLHGDYKLIVTSVSISITEDKPTNKIGKTIFTWPYRHIRRYGCSKDNFSFEAGRKCLSGEGLFAFATLDGCVIFQSVDSYVASLKSSQSDGDAPSSPLLDDDKNSYVFSYKEEPGKPVTMHSPINNFDLVSGKFCAEENSSKQDAEKLKLQKEKNISKSVHPVSKPPRKSKQSSYANVSKNNEEKFKISVSPKYDSDFSSNLYEDPENPSYVADSTFEKGLYNKGDEISETSVPKFINETALPSPYEPVYAVLEEHSAKSFDMPDLTVELERVHTPYENIHDSPNCSNTAPVSDNVRRESDCYDHLSLKKKFESSRALALNNSDHIYGKLLSTRSSSTISKSNTGSSYGSLNIKEKRLVIQDFVDSGSHSYTNVQLVNSAPVCLSAGSSVDSVSNEPKHFLRNDAEYAKVFKNRK